MRRHPAGTMSEKSDLIAFERRLDPIESLRYE